MKPNKIFQPEQITVLRSQINFAAYNPRTITDDARKKLKKNLQTVGLLGGVVWNKRTGNLVSGHQRVAAMDAVNRYDDDGSNDYEFRVEVVDFDEKTEKEQNLFMNNRNVQGQFDDDLLRKMLSEVDYSAAGYEETDLQLLGLADFDDYGMDYADDDASDLTPGEAAEGKDWNKEDVIGDNQELAIHNEMSMDGGEDHKLDRSTDFYQADKANQVARHNEVQKIKDRINSQNDVEKDGGVLSYVVLSFKTPTDKMTFMQKFGLDPMAKYVNGNEFDESLERWLEFDDSDQEDA